MEVWGCVAEAGTVLGGDVEGDLEGVCCFEQFIGCVDTLFPLAMYCVYCWVGWSVQFGEFKDGRTEFLLYVADAAFCQKPVCLCILYFSFLQG